MQIAFLLNKEKATLLMTLRFPGNVVPIIRYLPQAGSWEQTVRKLQVLPTKAWRIQFILFISKHTCRGLVALFQAPCVYITVVEVVDRSSVAGLRCLENLQICYRSAFSTQQRRQTTRYQFVYAS